MKSLSKIVLMFLISVSICAQSWQWVNPLPQGNQLNAVSFINANTGVAGGSLGTIIKTTDGGTSWRIINTNTTKNIQELTVATLTTFYASGDSGLVLRSTNAGETWSNVSVNSIYSIWNIQFFDENSGYASGLNSKFYKTSNGGANWTEITIPGGGDYYSMTFFGPQSGYLTSFSGKILKTMNGGLNWSETYTGRSATILKLIFTGGIGYGACSGGEVIKTTNDGQSWFLAGTAGSNVLWDVHFTDASNGVVLDDNGKIYRTTNGGVNWSMVLTQNNKGRAFSFAGQTGYWVGGGGRIYKTNNGGLNWVAMVNDKIQDISGICFIGDFTGYVTTYDGKLIKTLDGGQTWTQPNQLSIDLQDIEFINASTGIAVGAAGPNMFRTTNGGGNWVSLTIASGMGLRDAQFISSTEGFVTGDNGIVYRTTDAGATWNSISTTTNHSFLSVQFLNSETGFVAGYNSKIYRTVNGGLSWAAVDLPGSTQVTSIHFFNNTSGLALAGSGSLFRTTNGGLNWQWQDLGGYWPNSLKFVDPQTGYIAMENGTVSKTTNGGVNWTAQLQMTTNGLTEIEIISGNNIFMGGYYGTLLRYGTALTSNEGGSNIIPSEFLLEQNYPNPFNPATTIKYSIPAASNVSIKIFDVAGREVATLVNGHKTAGTYEVSFDASALSTGVYFYRIDAEGSTGSFTDTKKMILVK
jgi:photosystem II stability/assembly factor-like uncharacterized protein